MPRAKGMGGSMDTGRGQRRGGIGKFRINSILQKSTLGATLFAFASMLIGNWLDKKFSQKKSKDKSKQDESSQNKKASMQ